VAKKHKKAILYSSLLIECIWQIFIWKHFLYLLVSAIQRQYSQGT
jgi:hypothetical protein